MRFQSALGLTCALTLTASLSAQTQPRPATPATPTTPQTQPQPGTPATPAQTQPRPAGQAPVAPTSPVPIAPSSPFPNPMYRMNNVGKSLNLTPEQINNLNKVTDQVQARYRNDYAKVGTLNEADRLARLNELNLRYNNDWTRG